MARIKLITHLCMLSSLLTALTTTRVCLSATQDGERITSVVVPFRMLPSNHMVMDAKLNGKGPYRFIFDLGAPVTLLNNKTAEAVGAIPPQAPRSMMLGARGEGRVAELEAGSLRATNVPVVVMDHPALLALQRPFSPPLAGILGYTFWARYKLTIDYQQRTLQFTPIEFNAENLMTELPKRMTGPKSRKKVIASPEVVIGIVTDERAHDEGFSEVYITHVYPNTPAWNVELQSGDVIVTLDGRWITNKLDIYEATRSLRPGSVVGMDVIRNGQPLHVTLSLIEGL